MINSMFVAVLKGTSKCNRFFRNVEKKYETQRFMFHCNTSGHAYVIGQCYRLKGHFALAFGQEYHYNPSHNKLK